MAVVRRTLLLLVMPLLAFDLWAQSQELQAPQRIVQDISDRFQAYLFRQGDRIAGDPAWLYSLVDELLLPNVDLSRVSRLVLGTAWREASESQKQAFSTAFKDLLVGTYADLFHEYKRWEIRHLPLRVSGEEREIRVRTEVLFPGTKPVEVVYRMALTEQGWKAYDVIIEGVSLVTSYRSGFARKIRESGIDNLVTELEQLNRRRHSSGDRE